MGEWKVQITTLNLLNHEEPVPRNPDGNYKRKTGQV